MLKDRRTQRLIDTAALFNKVIFETNSTIVNIPKLFLKIIKPKRKEKIAELFILTGKLFSVALYQISALLMVPRVRQRDINQEFRETASCHFYIYIYIVPFCPLIVGL